MEFGRWKAAFKGKLANLLPVDEARLCAAKQLKNLILDTDEFQYEIFTNFEDAVEWLSEVRHLS